MVRKRRRVSRRRITRRKTRRRTGSKTMTVRIRGRGGYWTDKLRAGASAVYKGLQQHVPAGTWERLGTAGGGAMGGSTGAALGGLLGKGISSITGFGDYSVKGNSLTVPEGVMVPTFGDMARATRIRHREYVTDISNVAGSTAFQLLAFACNPGISTTFPWLSQIAENYQEYEVIGMCFEFVSTCSEYGGSSAPLGSVIMASDYNSVDANFSTKIAMENSQYCVSDKPSKDILHCIECDPSATFSPIKFVRDSSVPSGKDIRLYDHCNFQIAINGCPGTAGAVLGELWVTYDIALYKPILNFGQGTFIDHFQLPTTVSSSHYLAADTTTTSSPTYGTLGGTVKNSTYTFPGSLSSGTFLMQYTVKGASTALTNALTTTPTNASVTSVYEADGASVEEVTAGATATTQIITQCIKVTAANATWQITGGTLPGTITGGDLFVIQIPAGLN